MSETTMTPKLEVKNFNFYYGAFHALKNINLSIAENKVTAFIGPSGCQSHVRALWRAARRR